MAEKKVTRKVTKRVTQTVEDKILGVQPVEEVVTQVDYESIERKYKVIALHDGATPIFVNGTVIEAFIGSTNKQARENLIAGATKVITVDGNGKEAYKIEVIK